MRSPTEYHDPLFGRLLGFVGRWVTWIFLSAIDVFGDEADARTTVRDIVDILIFSCGWMGSLVAPLLMYLYEIGTTPSRIAVGVGIYLGVGLVYLWHEEYAVYTS